MLPKAPGFHRHLSTDHKLTLVWIDDYVPGLNLYKTIFEDLGFRVLTAASGRDGLDLVAASSVAAVVTDCEMPGMDGEAVVMSLKQSQPDLPVIMFTGSTQVPDRVRNLVDGFCDKAGPCDELLAVIHRALGKKRLLDCSSG
jgi:DNA-binding NtrC family response regulator